MNENENDYATQDVEEISTLKYPYNVIIQIFGEGGLDAVNSEIKSFETNLKRVARYEQIPPRDIDALIAHYRDGLSFRDISRKYNNDFSRQAFQMAIVRAIRKLSKEEYLIEFKAVSPEYVGDKNSDYCSNANDDKQLLQQEMQRPIISLNNLSPHCKSCLRAAGKKTVEDLAKLTRHELRAIPRIYQSEVNCIEKLLSEMAIPRPSSEIINGLKAFVKKYKISYKNLIETVNYVTANNAQSEASVNENK